MVRKYRRAVLLMALLGVLGFSGLWATFRLPPAKYDCREGAGILFLGIDSLDEAFALSQAVVVGRVDVITPKQPGESPMEGRLKVEKKLKGGIWLREGTTIPFCLVDLSFDGKQSVEVLAFLSGFDGKLWVAVDSRAVAPLVGRREYDCSSFLPLHDGQCRIRL